MIAFSHDVTRRFLEDRKIWQLHHDIIEFRPQEELRAIKPHADCLKNNQLVRKSKNQWIREIHVYIYNVHVRMYVFYHCIKCDISPWSSSPFNFRMSLAEPLKYSNLIKCQEQRYICLHHTAQDSVVESVSVMNDHHWNFLLFLVFLS